MNTDRIRQCMFLVLIVMSSMAGCATTPERRFASPDQAVDSLVQALRSYDRKELTGIFGSDAADLISSGDETADRNGVNHFLELYDARHNLNPEPDGSMTLVIGDQDWPLPIPLVKDEEANAWYFDAATGQDEIINRRVGRNELATMQVCLAAADAQREYALNDLDGNGIQDYARKFISDPGQRNGLYWPTDEGQPPSPLGLLVSQAAEKGYTASSTGKPQPYHGYRYRLLTSQGPNAPGGAFPYVVQDKMIGGFALIAYPAEYGASGVMSFIMNHAGVVYERDLGSQSTSIAEAMTEFDPGPEWTQVDPAAMVQP